MALVQQWISRAIHSTQTCRAAGRSRRSSDAVESAEQAEPRQARATLAIVLRGTGTVVGRIRYFDLNPRNRSCEIGYHHGPKRPRKGLRTRSGRRFCSATSSMVWD